MLECVWVAWQIATHESVDRGNIVQYAVGDASMKTASEMCTPAEDGSAAVVICSNSCMVNGSIRLLPLTRICSRICPSCTPTLTSERVSLTPQVAGTGSTDTCIRSNAIRAFGFVYPA